MVSNAHRASPVMAWGCSLLAAALCFSLLLFPLPASADELDDARAELDAKTAELEGLTMKLEAASANVQDCQQDLESITGSILLSQTNLALVQKRLADVSRLMYKSDELSIIQIVMSSQSIDELLSRISQLEAVATQASNLAVEEKRAQDALASDYEEASRRKDAAQAARNELQSASESLQQAASELEQRIAELEEEKALAKAAEEAAAALEAASRAAREAGNVGDTEIYNATVETEGASEVPVREEAPEETYQAQAQPEDEATHPEQVATTYETGDTTGWSTGVASAYGGSSDPYTPNPGTTATGAVCDDYSVGVAVPMAWGPSAYYGRLVEISYNGMTVVATVNDCGGMGGGSRSLDLQPGVFKAFGFSTCQDWGIREVQYRFL